MRVTRSSANRNAESEAEAAEAAAWPSRPGASGSRVSGSGPTKVETKTKSRGRKRVNADADEDRGTDKESTSKRRASASRAVGGKTDEREDEHEQEQEQQGGNSRSSTSKRNARALGDKTTTTKSHSAASADPTPTHTPQPPFPGRVSLDPAFYPHLFDTILEHHTAADLVSLRATCRALRERVDVQLARHLVLKFRTREKNSVHVVPRVFELDYRFSALPGTWGELDHWRPLFEHTRVLDLCGDVSELLKSAPLGKLADVPILRLRGRVPFGAAHPFKARTIIVLGGVPQGVECGNAVTEKVVFAMAYRASEESPDFLGKLNFPLGPGIRELVFLVDKRAEKKPRRSVWMAPGDEYRIDWMDVVPVVMLLGTRARPPKITFVDVVQNMELPPWVLDGGEEEEELRQEEEEDTTGDNEQALALEGDAQSTSTLSPSAKLNRRLVRAVRKDAEVERLRVGIPLQSEPEFEFLTREEYRASVGDEVFALEKGI